MQDLRQHFRGNEWGWRSYYFALKSGPVRKLLWCKRPTDELCAGVVHVRDITAVQPLDTPGGEICLIVEYRVNDRDDLLTLRAASLKSREAINLIIEGSAQKHTLTPGLDHLHQNYADVADLADATIIRDLGLVSVHPDKQNENANTDAFRFAFARLDSSKEALETMLAEDVQSCKEVRISDQVASI
eukprot:g14782.t1